MAIAGAEKADKSTDETPDISVIVPVTERPDAAMEIHRDYRSALDRIGKTYEFLYILDGSFRQFRRDLELLKDEGERLTIIQLGKHFGEAAALEAGREHSRGQWILTLPAYYQVDPEQLELLFQDSSNWDLNVARRYPRIDSKVNQGLSRVFHALVNWVTASNFHDLGNGVRLIRKDVLDEIPLYGDQHRFLPILASKRGYRTREVNIAQSTEETFRRVPKLGVYPRRLLDLLTVFFLVKFTKKPLRFFGLIGAGVAALGGISTVILIIQRLFFDQALAQRPALLLAALLIVLGVQIFALGLIGEIVIYAHAREIREYTIEEIIN